MRLLILSHDDDTVTAFRRSSGEMHIHLHLCEEASAARAALEIQRYDALIIDCDDIHAGTTVLKSVRSSRANRAAVVLALLNGGTHDADAIDMGADLVLSKPVSCDRARQELRRLHLMAGRDQRRHPRFAAEGVAYVSSGDTVDRLASIVNLALGGMGLCLHERLDNDDLLRLRFQLPGTSTTIQAQGEIAWADPKGAVGVRFVSLSETSRAELEKWLRVRAG